MSCSAIILHIISLLALLGLSGYSFPLFGQSLEQQLLEGKSLEQLELLVADNPQELSQQAAQLLPIYKSGGQEQFWLRLVLLRLQAAALATEHVRDLVTPELFHEALILSERQGLEEERILLLGFVKDFGEVAQRKVLGKNAHTEAISLARKLGRKRLLVRALADAALFYEDNLGDSTEALVLAKEVWTLLAEPGFPRFEATMARTKLGLIFDQNKLEGQALGQTYERILSDFQKLRLRQFQVIMHYNLATFYSEQEAGTQQEKRHLDQILEIAPTIADWATYGQALAMIAMRNAREQRWGEAEQNIRTAEILLSRKSSAAYQDFLLHAAYEVAKLKGNQKAALDVVDLSQAQGPFVDPSVELTYLRQRHEALFALKRYEEAYGALLSYHKAYQEFRKKELEETRDWMKADIGLTQAEHKAKALELENEYKGQKIEAMRLWNKLLFSMGTLAIGLIVLLMLWLRQSQKLRQEQKKRQQILELIDEGIVTIDSFGKIREEHSPYLTEIFDQQSLVGRSIFEILTEWGDLPKEQIPLLRETIQACIGEDELVWELNHAHMPVQILLHKKVYLALHWQAIFVDGKISGFLLGLRDVTSQALLELDLSEQRRQSLALHERLQELLSVRFGDACQLVERLNTQDFFFSQASGGGTFEQRVHTAKGEARSLGLKQLSLHLHELEDYGKRGDSARLQDGIEFIKRELKSYLLLIEELKRGSPLQQKERRNLLDICSSLLPGVLEHLVRANLRFERIEIGDEVEHWAQNSLKALQAILLHGFANAIDHGYLRPISEGRMPPRAVSLRVRAYQDGQEVRVELTDGGYGLDFLELRKLARIRGSKAESELELINLLFEEGSSTAREVSETSGRGVGLGAIRQICRDLGGDVRLSKALDAQGTLLCLSWPQDTVGKEAIAC